MFRGVNWYGMEASIELFKSGARVDILIGRVDHPRGEARDQPLGAMFSSTVLARPEEQFIQRTIRPRTTQEFGE